MKSHAQVVIVGGGMMGGQRGIHYKHGDDNSCENNDCISTVHNARTKQHANCLHVVGAPGHDISCSHGVKERGR